MDHTLKTFICSYIETMLWAEVDSDGQPLDSQEVTFSLEALRTIVRDCTEFEASELCALAVEAAPRDGYSESLSLVAHDFWLTRNRHGAGFWDGDYPKELGKKLTEYCHTFGELSPYIGDDGKLYF